MTIVEASGVERLEAKFNAVEAFAWEINSAYVEQEHDGPRYGLSREDLRYCWQVAKHAKARWELALYEELARRWGRPADAMAAARLPIPPWQQAMLLADRPQIPLDPSREPHAVPDIPAITHDWQGAVQVFLGGRRKLLEQLGTVDAPLFTNRGPTRPVGDQRTFAEASQPPERDDEALERFDRAVDALGVIDPRPPEREREPGEDDDIGDDEDSDPQLH
jgi:hypothetical protein